MAATSGIAFGGAGHTIPSQSGDPCLLPRRLHDVLDGLRALGLAAISANQVEAAVKAWFPGGLDGVDRAQVVRAVFLKIKRRDTSDNAGR